MRKITYVCDACAHVANDNEELVAIDEADGSVHIFSHPFVASVRNHLDYALTMEVSIHNESDAEFHLCNECIIGQLENIIQEIRDDKNAR